MPSPSVSPVTRPNSVSTPTLPVGIEVTLHNKRSTTITPATIRKKPEARKLGMAGMLMVFPLRELSDNFPSCDEHRLPFGDGEHCYIYVGSRAETAERW